MDENNQIDEFDKMFYDYFDNNKEVPQRIHDTIYSAFDRRRQKRKRINILKRVAMIVISFGVMTTGIVFADDIINFITSLFTNSTDGIESAVQNGYVQTVDMEYVYDNDIGVKVDNVVLDDTNLDISFIYNYQGNEKIDSLELYEYTIKDENENILYEYKDNVKKELTYPIYINRYNDTILIEENTYKDSLIYTSKEFSKIKKLIIDIKSFKILSTNDSNIKNGNWNIEFKLDDSFQASKNEFFITEYNEFINYSRAELTETALKLEIELNMKLDKSLLREYKTIILRDSISNEYNYKLADLENINENTTKLYLEYDISKYFNNIDNLELIIKSKDGDIHIKFKK